MRSDRTTLCGVTLEQVDSKFLQVPHNRRSEGAAIQQRPGALTSSTISESTEESPALYAILACLFLWIVYAQSEALGLFAAVALAFWATFPLACAVAADLPHALWSAIEEAGGYLLSDHAIEEAGGYLLSDHARPAAVSLLCLMPTNVG